MDNLNRAENLMMNPDSFRLLRDFIYSKSGIFFADNKQAQLESRLAQRLKANNLSDFDQYYDLLKYDDPAGEELHHLFDSVSTNETSFFRSPPQIEAFKHKVLPDLLAALSASRRLRRAAERRGDLAVHRGHGFSCFASCSKYWRTKSR